MLVLVVPLLTFALMLSDNDHRRPAIVIFITGISLYLGFAIYTLSGELMAPLIGHVYVPSLIFMTPICLYAICHSRGSLKGAVPSA